MGVFSDITGGDSSDDCTGISTYEAKNVVGSHGLHNLFTIIGAALAICTVLVSLFLSIMHLANYSQPRLQRQLVRAILMPGVYATFAFFAVWFYDAAKWLTPIADLYEVFALVAIFYYINYAIMPQGQRSMSVFGSDWNTLSQYIPGGDLVKYSKTWIGVVQILPGRIILTIIQFIVNGIWCTGSKHLKTATTVINVLNGIQTAICVISILRFYKQAKPQLAGHKIVFKLVVFKVPIALQLVQRAVFSGLNNHDDLHPTATISQADWFYGVPGFMTLCEMFLVVCFFVPAFSWRGFTAGRRAAQAPAEERRGFVLGVVDVLNVSDIISGVLFALRLRAAVKGGADSRGPGQEQGYDGEYAQQNAGYAQQEGGDPRYYGKNERY